MAPADMPCGSCLFVNPPEQERTTALTQHGDAMRQRGQVVEVGLTGAPQVAHQRLRPLPHGRQRFMRQIQVFLLAPKFGVVDGFGVDHEPRNLCVRPVVEARLTSDSGVRRGRETENVYAQLPKEMRTDAQKGPVISGEYIGNTIRPTNALPGRFLLLHPLSLALVQRGVRICHCRKKIQALQAFSHQRAHGGRAALAAHGETIDIDFPEQHTRVSEIPSPGASRR